MFVALLHVVHHCFCMYLSHPDKGGQIVINHSLNSLTTSLNPFLSLSFCIILLIYSRLQITLDCASWIYSLVISPPCYIASFSPSWNACNHNATCFSFLCLGYPNTVLGYLAVTCTWSPPKYFPLCLFPAMTNQYQILTNFLVAQQ